MNIIAIKNKMSLPNQSQKDTDPADMEIDALPPPTEDDILAEIKKMHEQTGYPHKAAEEIVRTVFNSRRLEEQVFLHQADKELAEREGKHAIKEARIDKLTEVANRRRYSEKMDEEIARAKRYGSKFSLIMIDIDHFKQFNDKHGHEMGDIVLREVARILGLNIRTMDMVARYGGEEFAVILPNTNVEHAEVVAQKLVSALESSTQNQNYPPVTISAGIAEFNQKSLTDMREDKLDSELKLRNAADTALYNAKNSGRNRAITYTEGMTMSGKVPDVISSMPTEIIETARKLVENPRMWERPEDFIAQLLPQDPAKRKKMLNKLMQS